MADDAKPYSPDEYLRIHILLPCKAARALQQLQTMLGHETLAETIVKALDLYGVKATEATDDHE